MIPLAPLWGRVTEAATVYEPEGAQFLYRVVWDRDHGYRVQRRPIPAPEHLYHHWDRITVVENWIELDGGQWDPSPHARPVVKFQTLGEAEAVITADLARLSPLLLSVC